MGRPRGSWWRRGKRYFELSAEIETGKRDGDYVRAIRAARATYSIFPAVVLQWKREYGAFDISTSHAVHTAPKLMAVMEDREGIRELGAVLESVEELRDWLPYCEEAEADVEIVPRIVALVESEPGILQSSLKSRLPGDGDAEAQIGARASNLAAWLEKAGRILRVRNGSNYKLYPVGYRISNAAASSPSPPFSSTRSASSASSPSSSSPSSSLLAPPPPPKARTRRSAAKARLLDLDRLRVVRLPRAPLRWEERDQCEKDDGTRAGKKVKASGGERFKVRGEGWMLAAEEKLALADRPDPTYKDVFPTGRYTHLLDP